MIYRLLTGDKIIQHIRLLLREDWQRIKQIWKDTLEEWKTQMSDEEYEEFYKKYEDFIDFAESLAKVRGKKKNKLEYIKGYFQFMDEDEKMRFLRELINYSTVPIKLKIIYRNLINKHSPFRFEDLEDITSLENLFKKLRYLS